MLVMTVFPNLMIRFTKFLEIEVASNGLFAISIFLVIMMLVFLTSVATELTERIKKMAQKTAIIEKRLRDLEERKSSYAQAKIKNAGKDEKGMKPAIVKREKKRLYDAQNKQHDF